LPNEQELPNEDWIAAGLALGKPSIKFTSQQKKNTGRKSAA